jgi:hypothetical protein
MPAKSEKRSSRSEPRASNSDDMNCHSDDHSSNSDARSSRADDQFLHSASRSIYSEHLFRNLDSDDSQCRERRSEKTRRLKNRALGAMVVSGVGK